ncbi:iron chelate uptake ABC transporter family permease subunit [Edwardsiella sp. LADL05-105]|uniref:iron chelate uptake ABC transporter family permease subunit n=1 Tax=Edwardsiella sp. LADL05-105 TaxID=1650654 RepID=UPI001CEC8D43|nr:iron chelate uptake ABC transporter family permease subunit [Edwardsiella sp. LADL05-105]UBU94839.1 iron chelate uptake ABC transporter family permease subunit [Edwardsiella sp. LADL05-105]
MSGAVRLAAPLLLLTLAVASLQWAQPLTLLQQWQLLLAPQQAQSLDDILWLYSQLPRLAITLLVGATLGLAGSVMQQLTQNALMSPLTMGTSSGAWLALVLLAAFWPGQQAQWGALAAMGGALLAFALIVLIAGLDNMTGLPMVIAGMVINILLGALASGVLLLQHPYAQNIFLWGSGDLAQSDWGWVRWLLPRLTPALLLLLFAPRVLQLLRLGHQGAQARGAAVVPLFFALMLLTIWLVSAAVTAVGLIGFIGLLTPNIVRALGVRTPRGELYASLLGGALLLLLTDALAQGGGAVAGAALADRRGGRRYRRTGADPVQPASPERAGWPGGAPDIGPRTGFGVGWRGVDDACCVGVARLPDLPAGGGGLALCLATGVSVGAALAAGAGGVELRRGVGAGRRAVTASDV